MQSEKVAYCILDLLQQVPSVYVAGLGRFDAIFHPATLDEPKARILPPHLEAVFTANDGADSTDLLAGYLDYVTGMGKAQAHQWIKEFTDSVLSRVNDGQSYTIQKFGQFTSTAAGHIHFTPDWDAFNLSFRGLKAIDLQATVPAEKRPEPTLIHPEEREIIIPQTQWTDTRENYVQDQKAEIPVAAGIPVSPVISDSTSRLWWIILITALVLIALLCAYLAWDIISNKQKIDTLADVFPEEPVTGTIDDVATIPDTVVESTPPPVQEPEVNSQEPVAEEPPESTEPPCYVVVGAFGNPDNVSRMQQRIESMGMQSEVFKGRTLSKVAIRTSCDKLQEVLNEARASINPEAWVY